MGLRRICKSRAQRRRWPAPREKRSILRLSARIYSIGAPPHAAADGADVPNRNRSHPREPHVVVYGLFGTGNTGNDATLEVTLQALRVHAPAARITVVTPAPEQTAADFGVAAVSNKLIEGPSRLPGPLGRLQSEAARWRSARAMLATADCLLIPGTGILDDFGATVMGHAYQLWKWCAAARGLGVPVKFVSVGAGPVEKPWSRRLFRAAARAADHRSYRDQGSLAFARDVLGLDVSGDRVTPDMVFAMEAPAPAALSPPRSVGVGVMEYHNWLGAAEGGDAYAPYMEKLSTFAAGLLRQGMAIRILTGDTGDAAAADDLHRRLAALEPGRASAVSRPHTPTLRALFSEIAGTDAVVATRYHTIVGALLCGRPAVSLGYAAKNRAVMEAFGLGQYCQNIWDFELSRLNADFAAVTVGDPSASAQREAAARRLRTEVQQHLASVIAEIGVGRARAP